MPKGIYIRTKPSGFKKGHIGHGKGIPRTEELKQKVSNSLKGHPVSESSREKMRLAKIGNKCHLGHKQSEITKQKLSAHFWKGGRRVADARKYHKRRQLGFIPLNQPFEGSDAHHIDKEHVIYIPTKIHVAHKHALNKPDTMIEINRIAKTYLEKS